MKRLIVLFWGIIIGAAVYGQSCPNIVTLSTQSDVDNFNCTSVVTLRINGSAITDLSGLSSLTSVTAVEITGTAVSDLIGLENITPRGTLTIRLKNNTNLTSLQGLASDGLTLEVLEIENNRRLTDLAGLPAFNAISFLQIEKNSLLRSLSGLSATTIVSRAYLDGRITNFGTAFQGQSSLNYLKIANSTIADLQGLFGGNLNAINQLIITGCPNLTSLAGLPAGQSDFSLLNLANLSSFESFAGIPSTVSTIDNLVLGSPLSISDLTSMPTSVSEISNVSLQGDPIASLNGMPTGQTSLEKLFISSSFNLTDMTGFLPSSLTTVDWLYFSANFGLRSIDGLDGVSINNLTLQQNASLTSLESIPGGSYEYLYLDGNGGIQNLSTLPSDVSSIRRLAIGGGITSLEGFPLASPLDELSLTSLGLTSFEGFFPSDFPGPNRLLVTNNSRLSNLNGIPSSFIDFEYILIQFNLSLTSLSGTDGFRDVRSAEISLNFGLTDCCLAKNWILNIPDGSLILSNNAGNCNSTEDIEASICDIPCIAPVVSFNAEDACFKAGGTTVAFTDNTEDLSPDANYLWDFGDATTSTQKGDVTHLYSSAGEYTVTLTVSNDDCTGSYQRVVTIFPEPQVDIDLPQSSVCKNAEPFQLTGGIPSGGVYVGGEYIEKNDKGEYWFIPAKGMAPVSLVGYYYTDANGCSGTATAFIEVLEDEGPVLATKDITKELGDDGLVTVSVDEVVEQVTDACDPDNIQVYFEVEGVDHPSVDLSCSDLPSVTYIVVAVDGSGNRSMGSETTISIVDVAPPVMLAKESIEVTLDENGEATLYASDIDEGSTDNCSEVELSLDIDVLTCSDVGEDITAVLTGTDASGNTATAEVSVSVNDGTAPTVLLKDITVALSSEGVAEISPEDLDDGSFDNCSISSLSIDQSAFTCDNVGDNEVTLTATDGSGNSASAKAIVTVEYERPVISEPEITASVNLVGEEVGIYFPYSGSIVSAQIDWGDGYIEDIEVTKEELAGYHVYAEQGVYSVKLTAIDACAGRPIIKTFDSFVIYENISAVVTGGGWFDSPVGAYVPDPTIAAKAHFAFAFFSYDKKDKKCGKLVFKVHEADLRFMSEQIEYMVVTLEHAFISGTGYMHGSKLYRFLLTVSDNKKLGNERDDRIRMKIWEKQSGELIYDNQFGNPDGTLATQQIDRGAIVIHIKKSSNYESHEEDQIADYVDTDLSLARSYPNPVSDQLNVEIPASFNDEVRLMMYDQRGIMVVDRKLNLVSGINNTVLDLAAMDLDRGVYMLRVQGTASSQTMRVIKN